MFKLKLRRQILEKYPEVDFDILTPPDGKMGDYSTNLAFVLAKEEKQNPKEIARNIIEDFKKDEGLSVYIDKVEEHNGFINFYLNQDYLKSVLVDVLEKGEKFGNSEIGKGIKINLEFVSANPTGPLVVVAARASSYGDVLGNVLKKVGYQISKEYYINDVGVQVGKLAQSIKLRIKEIKGEKVEFGEGLYQGEYIKEIAQEFIDKNISEELIQSEAIKTMVGQAKQTMDSLGVFFDEWFSESKLHESGEVKKVLADLESGGFTIDEDGAKWLKMNNEQKATAVGGAPLKAGAVLVKSDGSATYLLNDIAYTKNKLERGFTSAINIWGADHHGDVIRLKTGVSALGYDPDRLEILLHQMVTLKEGDQLLRMSKRKGHFVLLGDLIREVGKDAVRFFFLTRDLDTHMEFDVELAKRQSKENPVFYIQYAFARLNSVFEKCKNQNIEIKTGVENLKLIKEDEELRLLKNLSKFPEVLEDISDNYQVHHLAQYALGLASDFHKFYEKHHIIQEDNPELQSARLLLSKGVHIVLKICLRVMGISAPERM